MAHSWIAYLEQHGWRQRSSSGPCALEEPRKQSVAISGMGISLKQSVAAQQHLQLLQAGKRRSWRCRLHGSAHGFRVIEVRRRSRGRKWGSPPQEKTLQSAVLRVVFPCRKEFSVQSYLLLCWPNRSLSWIPTTGRAQHNLCWASRDRHVDSIFPYSTFLRSRVSRVGTGFKICI
jgi:hypothetical protein